MVKPDVDIIFDFAVAGIAGHIVDGQVIKPIRVGGFPTFQVVFDEEGNMKTQVNPNLSEEDRTYYQKLLDQTQLK